MSPRDVERLLTQRLAAYQPLPRKARRRPGSAGGARVRFGVVAAMTALMLAFVGGAFAVHDEGFQLEGNATAADKTYTDIDDINPGNPVDTVLTPGTLAAPYDGALDWDSLVDVSGPGGTATVKASLPGDFADADFRADFKFSGSTFLTSDDTTFATGSSDVLPISTGWQCNQDNNVNSKTDIINGYAALLEADDRILYFGLEKDVDNGSNNVGIWLFQDPDVGCSSSGPAVDFSGDHVDGDLFIVSAFTNGGGVSSVTAYRWDEALNTIDPNPVAVSADCLDAPASGDQDRLCGVINGKTITMPWRSVDNGVVNAPKISPNFFEGAINLDAFEEFEDSCFTGFLLETRSSPSLTANLFDYVFGDIDTCRPDLNLDKEPENQTHNVGDSFDWTLTVDNTGDGDADDAVVTDTIPDGLTINSATVDPAAAGSCDVDGQDVECTIDVPAGADVEITINVTSTLDVFGESEDGCVTVTNTGSVSDDEDESANNDSDSAVATICRPQVSKTADGHYTETHTWSVTKSVDPNHHDANAGETESSDYDVDVDETVTDSAFFVTGTITITNPNPEDDMTVDVTDALGSGETASATDIDCDAADGDDLVVPAGNSVECTYTIDTSDATAGTNTATVTLNSIDFDATDGYDFTATVLGPTQVDVEDTFDGGTPESKGTVDGDETIEYDRTFTCPTDETLYDENGNYEFTKDNTVEILDGDTVLDSDDASVTVDCWLPVPSKTADGSFTRGRDWTLTKDVDPATHVMNAGQSGDSTYTVSVDLEETDSNFIVSGTITIDNPNPEDDMTVDVTDALSSGESAGVTDIDCGDAGDGDDAVVAANGSIECTYSIDHTTTPAASDTGTNTATVTLEAGDDDPQVTATDGYAFSPVFSGEPATINVTDTFDGGAADALGSVTGDTTFADYDRMFTCPTDTSLYEDGHFQFTKDNTAEITETGDSDSETVTVDCYLPTSTKTADGHYTETHTWSVTKSVDPDHHDANAGQTESSDYDVVVDETVTPSDFFVTGTITITNPSTEDDMTVDVTDALGSGESVAAADIDCDTDGNDLADDDGDDVLVEAGETIECTYTIDTSDADSGTNTATVTLEAGDVDPQVTATDGYTFTASVVGPTEVDVEDTFDGGDPETIGTTDGDQTFEYDRNFTCPTDETLYDENGNYEFTKDNTVEILDGDTVLDSDTASVTVDCWLPVPSKTADGSFDRDWDWTIDKTGDQTGLLLMPGQSFLVNYEVTLTPSSEDSNFVVRGTITIDNPNPEDDMTVDVTDALSSGESEGVADIDCGAAGDGDDAVVPAGGSIECTYSIAHTTTPAASDTGTNTATVTLEAGDDDPQVTATDDYAFALGVETDECVDLSDSLYGDLGEHCVGGDLTAEYTLDVGQEACGEFTVRNVASFVTNDSGETGEDDHTVMISIECDQGCTLTQGYWKTHSAYGPAPEDLAWLDLPDVDGDGTVEGPEEDFFLSGQSWYEVFWTAPKGNAYYNLAKQYMAAVLNGVNGATTTVVDDELAATEALFEDYTPEQIASLKGKKQPRPQFIELAGILASYNEGEIGPGHCDEDSTSSTLA